MTRKAFRPRQLTSRIRLVCLVLCCALGLQSFLVTGSPVAATGSGSRANTTSVLKAPASNLPNLSAERRRASQSPRAVPPVPSTMRRCLADDPHCSAYSEGSTEFSFTGASGYDFPLAAALFLDAPSNLMVTSAADAQVSLSWSQVAGASSYRIERSTSRNGTYFSIGPSASSTFNDIGAAHATSYLYRVCAANGAGNCISPYSNAVMATAYTFADDPIVTFSDHQQGINLSTPLTTISAQHITQLREAINAVRHLAGRSDASWTYATLTPGQSLIHADDVRDLRDRLGEALSDLGIPAPSYTDPALLTGQNPTIVKRDHIKELRLAATRGQSSGSGSGPSFDFSTARLDPNNRVGGDGANPYSRNYNWSIPLLSLPGRAGLDLGLALSYNSLVWTKDTTGAAVTFDADHGSPSPGFRLGFPIIEPPFFNTQTGKMAYMLLTPSGSRVELRETTAPGVYESADSSYLQLIESGSTLALYTTDGSRLSFDALDSQYLCSEVRDRNGNFISVSYYSDGRIDKVTDTLGRTITFNYDANQRLLSITQPWKRETEDNPNGVDETHTWATFGYANKTLAANSSLFSNLTVSGTQGGTTIPVLSQVGLDDGSYYKLNYNGWGQVWKATHFAADSVDSQGVPNDSHALSYTRLNLPGSDLQGATPQSDCPRFTEERTWVENGVMNQSAEVTMTYSAWTPNMASCDVTMPDGTTSFKDIYETTSWKRGLTTESQVWSGGVKRKWTSFTWDQDNTSASYQINPRVTDTTVNDAENNHRRTSVTYTSFGLPQEVTEYGADTTTVLRTTRTEYNIPNLSQYTSRRIIGLPGFRYVYEGASVSGALLSKIGYVYDDDTLSNYLQALPSAAAQHDGSNYSTAFRWRGNISRIRRYDVTGGASSYIENKMGYNVTGAVAFTKDALDHQTTISYTDAFYQNVNRTNPVPQYQFKTFAYPTTVTNPDGFSATSVYNYDMGVGTKAQTPLPNVTTNQPGPEVKRLYDSMGRLLRVTNSFNAARMRMVYMASMNLVQTFTQIEANVEAYSASVLDGAGRVRATAQDLPGSNGGYAGQLFDYDTMGRLVRQSNPTETDAASATRLATGSGVVGASWTAMGDDYSSGWLYTQTSYDWKGRPLVVTNPGSPATTREFLYGGCGCAGGQTVTTRDELGRRQKVIYDVLGRVWKTQVLTQQDKNSAFTVDPNEAAYLTKTNSFDALDRLKEGRERTESTGVEQVTTMAYDGHGRLLRSHAPEQQDGNGPTYTNYEYYDDDMVKKVTDGRGATASLTYNNRHLLTAKTYTSPNTTSIPLPDAVSYSYDAAGNRTQMSYGQDYVNYHYDTLSQMDYETRYLHGLNRSYTLDYGYNLSGQLKNVTDPFGARIDYSFDTVGRVASVTGSNFANVSTYASGIQYRAWGDIKHITYGNARTLDVSFDSRMQVSGFQIPGVMSKTYGYYADGQLHSSTDAIDNRFDRSYNYDHVGRMTLALSGYEARGEAQGNSLRPYNQSFQYDALGHMVARPVDRRWTSDQTLPTVQTYQNNRNTAWQYDADGNLTSSLDVQYTLDAAGNATRSTSGNADVSQSFDGEGQSFYNHEVDTYVDDFTLQVTTQTTDTYLITSSVLGGRVVSEVTATGGKRRSFVYMGSGVLALQQQSADSSQHVYWEHRDSSNSSYRETSTTGDVLFSKSAEMDPLGTNVGTVGNDPEARIFTKANYPGYGSVVGSGFTQCNVDFMERPCAEAFHMMGSGIAQQCPENNCGSRIFTAGDFTGLTKPFRATGDGWSGFEPYQVTYTGDGFIFGPDWNDSGKAEKVSWDEIEYGSMMEAFTSYFTNTGPQEKSKKRRKHRRSRRGSGRTRVVPNGSAEGETALPTPLSNTNAPVTSQSEFTEPCADEEILIFNKVAKGFGGRFDNTQWAYVLPSDIGIDNMRSTMSSMGFEEFTNENIIEHRPTYEVGWGGYHWQGNVLGNWYHFIFVPTGFWSDQVKLTDSHYEAHRPNSGEHVSDFFHRRKYSGRRPCK